MDYQALASVNAELIVIHNQIMDLCSVPETEEFEAAKKKFDSGMSEFEKPKSPGNQESEEESWERFIEIQNAFIREQINHLMGVKLYGTMVNNKLVGET